MYKIISIFLMFLMVISLKAEDEFKMQIVKGPEVYNEVLKLKAEIEVLKEFFKVEKKKIVPKEMTADFNPRHLWQLAYLINVKINIFRVKHKLPRVEEVYIAPAQKVHANMAYDMVKRLQTEILIIKRIFGITKMGAEIQKVDKSKMNPSKLFNLLLEVSMHLDILNEQEISINDVYALSMRLFKDINVIFRHFQIIDKTVPMEKRKSSTNKNTFRQIRYLFISLQKLQKLIDIKRVNFDNLQRDEVRTEELFVLLGMALAEFQRVKAYFHIFDTTEPATIYKHKRLADVEQLAHWNSKKIKLLNQFIIQNFSIIHDFVILED